MHFTGLEWLESVSSTEQIQQLPILVIGIVLYILAYLSACRVAVDRFVKADP